MASAVAVFQIPTKLGDSSLLEVLCATAWHPCHRSSSVPFFHCSTGVCVGEICHPHGVDRWV